MSREYTKDLWSKLDSGEISGDYFARIVLNWMDEASVKEMCLESDLSVFFEESDEESESVDCDSWYDEQFELED